jgi:hypothetical protein
MDPDGIEVIASRYIFSPVPLQDFSGYMELTNPRAEVPYRARRFARFRGKDSMTIERDDQLDKLRTVGRLVARTLAAMGKALEPGMTTKELDDLGRALLEREGARSAPELTYGFPGAT